MHHHSQQPHLNADLVSQGWSLITAWIHDDLDYIRHWLDNNGCGLALTLAETSAHLVHLVAQATGTEPGNVLTKLTMNHAIAEYGLPEDSANT